MPDPELSEAVKVVGMEKVYSVKEVAKRIGVSRRFVRQLIEKGKLPANPTEGDLIRWERSFDLLQEFFAKPLRDAILNSPAAPRGTH